MDEQISRWAVRQAERREETRVDRDREIERCANGQIDRYVNDVSESTQEATPTGSTGFYSEKKTLSRSLIRKVYSIWLYLAKILLIRCQMSLLQGADNRRPVDMLLGLQTPNRTTWTATSVYQDGKRSVSRAPSR